MLIEILRFEWRYHTRQATFVVAAALFFVAGLVTTATGFGPANVNVNSPYSIAQSIGLLSLLSVFVLAVFCGNAIVRDRELRTEELIFATPVGKLEFLLGRFGGSLLAALTAFSLSAAGMVAALALPGLEPSRIGPVEPLPYLWALAVVGVPNFIVAAVILFVVATLSRSMLASYAAAVAIYVLYFVASALSGSPLMAASAPGAAGEMSIASLVDPFALSAFFEQTRFWTPAERNVRLIVVGGNFLLNRVAWIAVASVAWAVLYRIFAFRVMRLGRGRTPAADPVSPAAAVMSQRVVVEPDRGARAVWAALLSASRFEVRTILGSVPFLALNLLWGALAATEIVSEVTSGEYGSAMIPTTGIVLAPMMQPLAIVATVILIYYSAEVVWRERSTSLSAMLDATPAPGFVFVVSKWLGLCALAGALIATGSLVAVSVQLIRGGSTFDPGVAAGFAWFAFVPLALFAAAAVAVHTLSPGRFVGIFALVLVAIYSQRGDVVGLDHRLWRFGALPSVVHSEMNGFGDYVVPFHAYTIVWGAIAALLLVGASLVWRREPGARLRSPRRVVRDASLPARVLLASCAAVALLAGGWIFRNTNVLNRYESSSDVLAWKAGYEKQWKRIEPLAQPSITRIEARVDLRPEDRAYRVRGRYELLNRSEAPIPGLFVTVRREARLDSIAAAGARLVTRDARYGQYRLDFDTPLEPGARTTLSFDVTFENRGITEGSPQTMIVENGSWIPGWVCFPTLGYRASYELRDPRERREHGLPPVVRDPGVSGDLSDDAQVGGERVTFDLTLSTAPDQTAITSGRLDRAWTEEGRPVFRYVSDVPVANRINVMSARYEVVREQRGDVAVEVWYRSGHDRNLARILRAAGDTLGYMEENVAPYRHRQLRVVEIPSYWNFGGFAQPDTVVVTDKRGFLKDVRDDAPIDVVYRRVSHEVAHQWWGLGLTAATAPGASAIVESLTKYSELMVMRRAFGDEMVRNELVLELDRYLAGRADATPPEPPLDRVEGEDHIYYGKGAIVMHAIADLIGEAATNGALQEFYVAESGGGHAPAASQLVARLLAASPEPLRPLVAQWTSEVVLYDVKLEDATASKRSDGKWELEVRVKAAKTKVNDDGSESAIAMDELVGFAVYGDDAEERILSSSKLRILSGEHVLRLVLDDEPRRVVVDPAMCLIDRDRFDNGRQVKGQRS
ncbi:MAG: M1 family aminopeptidase [Thermoanaerobaculia bacterium]|jgi:ABC-type transport system involved in multi-copper enzyme maturation permease subunit